MNNQPQTKKSTPSTKKNTTGIKMLIMVGSLAGTLAGWGILATGQAQSNGTLQTAAVVQPANAASQAAVQATSQQASLRSVTVPAAQPVSVARTRSSR
jgi:hypothetical protein